MNSINNVADAFAIILALLILIVIGFLVVVIVNVRKQKRYKFLTWLEPNLPDHEIYVSTKTISNRSPKVIRRSD